MSRTELVKRSGISKQQLSRLENGQIRLRLDHLKPFAAVLGYSPEQILLWGRFPGAGVGHIESSDVLREEAAHEEPLGPSPGQVPELDTRAGLGGGGVPAREVRKDGRHADPLKAEGWLFPQSFVREQLHTSAGRLLVLDTNGDSMVPTIMSGERVIVDTGHKTPTPGRALRHSRHLRVHRRQAPAGAAFVPPDAGKGNFRQSESSERRDATQRARGRRQGALLPQIVLSKRPSLFKDQARSNRSQRVAWLAPRRAPRRRDSRPRH